MRYLYSHVPGKRKWAKKNDDDARTTELMYLLVAHLNPLTAILSQAIKTLFVRSVHVAA